MSKFKLIYEQIMSLCNESGNAIENVSRIKKQFIPNTLNYIQTNIFDKLNIQRSDWITLGSVGKKAESGDIDIGLDISHLLENNIIQNVKDLGNKLTEICEELGLQYNNRITTGTQIFHIGVPIIGQQPDIVQVDIMITNNLEYSSFKFWSPDEKDSKYKGVDRSVLRDAIIKYCTLTYADDATEEERQEFTNNDGKVYPHVKFQHKGLNADGLINTVKTFKGKRGYVTNPKKLSSTFITNNPQDIINDILGKDIFSVNDFNSFESIWYNVLQSDKFPCKDKISDIVKSFIRLKEKQNLPDEIIQYCKQNNINIDEL